MRHIYGFLWVQLKAFVCGVEIRLNEARFVLIFGKDHIFICNCRIWGEQGQAALEKASICLLNCGPTGSDTLKNLVLGGIGSITVVDGSKVEESDLGNNFMGKLFCNS